MKKSKPKQRTNWKQRALDCEEVIRVQNELAKAREQLIQKCDKHLLEIAIVADCQQGQKVLASVEALKARAELAEKRLAEFKRSEYFVSNACVECGSKREEKYMNYVCYSAKCLRACADKLDPIRTHWQRFKSFLKHWDVELLCLIVILCVTAGCVAYVYWPRG
jgi:hypothetical protein